MFYGNACRHASFCTLPDRPPAPVALRWTPGEKISWTTHTGGHGGGGYRHAQFLLLPRAKGFEVLPGKRSLTKASGVKKTCFVWPSATLSSVVAVSGFIALPFN